MAVALTVYDDEIVSASSLNRHSGEVLDKALRKPVTITRNEQAFALTTRERAAQLTAEVTRSQALVQIQWAALQIIAGKTMSPHSQYEWLTAFEPESLGQMLEELVLTYNRASQGETTWDEFDAVLHEWQESAWANRSESLRNAYTAEASEQQLEVPPPTEESE